MFSIDFQFLGLQDFNPEIDDAKDVSRFSPLVKGVDNSFYQTPEVPPWSQNEPNNVLTDERCVE